MSKNLPVVGIYRFDPWVRKMPWRREWWNTDYIPVFLPENSMDRGDLWAIVHRVVKSQTQLRGSFIFKQ